MLTLEVSDRYRNGLPDGFQARILSPNGLTIAEGFAPYRADRAALSALDTLGYALADVGPGRMVLPMVSGRATSIRYLGFVVELLHVCDTAKQLWALYDHALAAV